MSSTFGGLEMGKSALNAFRLGMQTVGHNISNMNTDGYSRQRVVFSTVTPENIEHVGQLGQGMYASSIERIRDEFLDFQFRDSQATLGYWEKLNNLYDSIQNYIAEPTSTGLRSAMDTFFTDMQTLQRSPEDTSARRAIVESANSVGGMLTNLIANFDTYNESVNMEVKQSVEDANRMLYDLAALNGEIATAEALDQEANDLYDQRDLILDKLSKMMDIQYNEPLEHNGIKGEFFLSVNGRVLVQGTHVRELKAHTFMWDNKIYYDVQVAENEFDIVDNTNIAEALAAGPEGTYQLAVDRVSNGVEWTAGSGNAHCLETRAIATSQFATKIKAGSDNGPELPIVELETSAFTDGIILDKDSSSANTLTFDVTDSTGTASKLDVNINQTGTMEIQTARLKNTITSIDDAVILDKYSSDGPYALNFTTNAGNTNITIQRNASGKGWDLSDGTTTQNISSDELTLTKLRSFINSVAKGFKADVKKVTANSQNSSVENVFMTFSVTDNPINVSSIDGSDSFVSLTDSNGLFGNLTETKYWEIDDGTAASKIIYKQEDLDLTSLTTYINKLAKSNSVGLTATADTDENVMIFRTNSPVSLNSSIALNDGSGILGNVTDIKDPDNTVLNLSGSFEIKLGKTESEANSNPAVTINVASSDTLATIRDKISSEIASTYSSFKRVEPSISVEKGYLEISVAIEDDPQVILITDGTNNVAEQLGLIDSSGDVWSDEDNIILDSSSEDIPYKLLFRVLDEDENPSVLTVKIDSFDYVNDNNCRVTGWKLRAELDGEEVYDSTTGDSNLTLEELKNFINDAAQSAEIGLQADDNDSSLVVVPTAKDSSLEVIDYSGMLGAITEVKSELTDVNMRTEVSEITDALNISGSFRLQVGTQGTRVTSKVFRENPSANLAEGDILAAGTAGERHTFRVGVSSDQVDFTALWNSATGKWILTSDLGTSEAVGATLSVKDLCDFMSKTFKTASSSDNPELINLAVTAGKSSTGTYTQFYIESKDNHLLSISDVEGNLAERLGIVNKNPVITINVENSDSLVTIRNKINEKYQAEFGLTEPEQWVHASVDNGYLEISANVAGEAQRITLMGSEDGNMQVLRRLGLTKNQLITSSVQKPDDSGSSLDDEETTTTPDYFYSYREVAYIPESGVANDASFSLNGVRYLSSDNKFNMARRIPATTGESLNRYSATELSEVSEGMWLNLKAAGNAVITVRHHIRDGSIKGLEEARDKMLPNLKSELDEMAYGLVKHINALQYSGYGISSDITTTGVAFFDPIAMKSGASEKLKVNDRVASDPSLIGAAMGQKDENGFALKGISGGSGDGTNASRMNDLNFDKVLENGTMTISGIYDAMLSQIGSEAGHASLMYKTQATVSEQIDSQRQAVSGVNLDEELMDIVILNRAFGAMSRYITTLDEMLNTIINGMGLVGR